MSYSTPEKAWPRKSLPSSQTLRAMAAEFGFDALGVTGVALPQDEVYLQRWLAAGRHGTMSWMARHGLRRARPAELVPRTIRVISVRMNYLPRARDAAAVLADPQAAYISRYALGRDYHKLMRRRLARFADRLASRIGTFDYRAFVDSAPVLEKALARQAGLGWVGKHTNVISRDAGSWFFLGEIYTDLPLPVDQPVSAHCGSCRRCIDVCPTDAIVAPYQLDARRCISYLTIEHDGPIPEALRPAIGNRIYGCDDCQLVCPWNRYAQQTAEADFAPRHGLDNTSLAALFAWRENEFTDRLAGSAIRRIGYRRWLRNIAVALGNATGSESARQALASRRESADPLVREHIQWALARHAQQDQSANRSRHQANS